MPSTIEQESSKSSGGTKRKRPEEISPNHVKEQQKESRASTRSSGTFQTKVALGRCPNVSDRYEKIARIGQGTYGVVYQARDKCSGKLVALKRCLPHHESTGGFPVTTLREIQVLRKCRHDAIVSLYDIAVSASSRSGVFLVFEFCPHDLSQLVDAHYATHKKSPFGQADVKRLVWQLLSALDFLHTRYMIHRDIKMSNLLYTNDGKLKLADFGLARTFSKDSALTPKVVSLWYRPPELLFGAPNYTTCVDLWGAGCVLAELLEGQPLLNGKNEMEQCSKMFQLLGPPTVSQWPDLFNMPLIKDGTFSLPQPTSIPPKGTALLDRFGHLSGDGLSLLSKLLSYDPSKRVMAARALESKFFTTQPTPTHPRLMPKFPSKHATKF